MSVQLNQLVYTSFPGTGFRLLASAEISPGVQQGFVQSVVHRYWNAYSPPPAGYRAAYLHQLTLEHILFGWLYNADLDDLGRSHVPYFICYEFSGPFNINRLEVIFDCLEKGPISLIDQQSTPTFLAPVIVPDACDYQPVQQGVTVPTSIRDRSWNLLEQKILLDFLIPVEPHDSPHPSHPISEQTHLASLATALPSVAAGPASDAFPFQTGMPEHSIGLETEITPATQTLPVTKRALLIGVSDYGFGFQPLPGSLQDVAAMKQVLERPDRGGFAEVETLLNPDPQTMAEAIETLFLDRGPDDLVLLYFSGHGNILDPQGKVCLTTGKSRQGKQSKVVRSTVITADFLTDVIDDSQARQKILILDWCLSGPTEPVTNNKINRSMTLEQQLSGPDRIILASATSTELTFAHKGEDLSAYTSYLVEGLGTGAADLNHDGVISVQEWHQYARAKVRQAAPVMEPRIYGTLVKDEILVAPSPIHDPKFRYRRQVERCSSRSDEISPVDRVILDTLYHSLNLSSKDASEVEAAAFKPYREYQAKLHQYAAAFVRAIQQDYPLGDYIYGQFKQFQAQLGLTDADIAPVESALIQQANVIDSTDQEADWTGLKTSSPRSNQFNIQQRLRQTVQASQSTIKTVARAIRTLGRDRLTVGRGSLGRPNPDLFRKLSRVVKANLDFGGLGTITNQWLWLGGGTFTALILIAAVRQQQYTHSLAQEAVQLEEFQTLAQQKQYEACITQTQAISKKSRLYASAQKLLIKCQTAINWQNVQVQTLPGPSSDVVWSVVLSPDGQILATNGDRSTVKVWDLKTRKLLHTLSGHIDTVWSLAISPDRQTLASSSGDMTIKLWDLKTGKLRRTLTGHWDTIWSIAISSDGQTLISSSADQTIKLWRVDTGKLVRTLSGHGASVRTIAISPDGETLASGSDDRTIRLWQLGTGKLLHTLSGHSSRIISVAFSPDGKNLASGSGDKTIKLWDSTKGQLLRTLSGHMNLVTAVAFSPNGKTLASGSQDNTIKLWNSQTGKLVRNLAGHSSPVSTVAFGPDGETLASGSQDRVIKLWRRE